MQWIAQDEATASARRIPIRLVDASDGETEETGVTITTPSSELQVSKNGAAFANGAGTFTEVGLGEYYYEATQAEVDTRGVLRVRVNVTVAKIEVAAVQIIDGSSTRVIEEIAEGTVDNTTAPTTTQFDSTEVSPAQADLYNGSTVIFRSGNLQGLRCKITDYEQVSTPTRGRFTVAMFNDNALPAAPSSGDEFSIV